MVWNFISRYPTASAWNARPFKGQYTLQDVIQELRQHIPNCQGQLVFNSDDIPESMKENRMQADHCFYVQYNHIRELEEYMESIQWNQKKNLDKVVLYHMGYFIQ